MVGGRRGQAISCCSGTSSVHYRPLNQYRSGTKIRQRMDLLPPMSLFRPRPSLLAKPGGTSLHRQPPGLIETRRSSPSCLRSQPLTVLVAHTVNRCASRATSGATATARTPAWCSAMQPVFAPWPPSPVWSADGSSRGRIAAKTAKAGTSPAAPRVVCRSPRECPGPLRGARSPLPRSAAVPCCAGTAADASGRLLGGRQRRSPRCPVGRRCDRMDPLYTTPGAPSDIETFWIARNREGFLQADERDLRAMAARVASLAATSRRWWTRGRCLSRSESCWSASATASRRAPDRSSPPSSADPPRRPLTTVSCSPDGCLGGRPPSRPWRPASPRSNRPCAASTLRRPRSPRCSTRHSRSS